MTVTELTSEEVLAMEPGPDMDKLVAERSMGWTPSGPGWLTDDGYRYASSFEPSTDRIAAMEVYGRFTCGLLYRRDPTKSKDFGVRANDAKGGRICVESPNPELAICQVALLYTIPLK